ncbi:DsrE family protein [Halobacterium bonnevillei]|uniref:Uncharacterized protein n=1 Tax=Halobacterium bonnevillei TaxID=2692200 RepID=A0A6B0SHA3_9EURY|nr:DsrE family protein [Halobacterium bonnevillei]MXR21204.1 hypothetical protein [Halobacterium bonnevillei]
MSGQRGVVVHVSSDDIGDWKMAIRNLVNLARDESVPTPPDAIQLVVNGPGVRFLLATGTESPKVSQMVTAGVTVDVCANSLERFGHDPDDLTDGVTTVQSGVAEVLRAQKAGKDYLKLP